MRGQVDKCPEVTTVIRPGRVTGFSAPVSWRRGFRDGRRRQRLVARFEAVDGHADLVMRDDIGAARRGPRVDRGDERIAERRDVVFVAEEHAGAFGYHMRNVSVPRRHDWRAHGLRLEEDRRRSPLGVAVSRRGARVDQDGGRRHPPDQVRMRPGADEFDDVSGLWMELIVGDTLAEMLRARGPLGSQEVIAIGKTLCAALAAVHQAGLVHQDIKAQNVMRERGARAGRYVLMDLGAGMDVSDPAAPRWGTPEYAAPEILFGARATIESDIYSLGVLLFYLLTSRFPVPGDSLEAIRDAHQRSERLWLRDLRPVLPAQFVETIDRALAPTPSRRFPSAGALAEALVFDES